MGTQVIIMVIRAIESGIRMQTIAGTLGLSLEKCERSGRVPMSTLRSWRSICKQRQHRKRKWWHKSCGQVEEMSYLRGGKASAMPGRRSAAGYWQRGWDCLESIIRWLRFKATLRCDEKVTKAPPGRNWRPWYKTMSWVRQQIRDGSQPAQIESIER